MNKELKVVVANVLQSNLAMLGAFIAVSSTLPEEQQAQLLQSLENVKRANQALLEMINAK
jgi:Pyruvate/2-oxoacid:ferredoxin oxidoreductase gamma subunit